MYLIDDIDSFEPKATKIMTQGLSPICDHAGFDDGHFCCLECSTPIFDRDDLILEGNLLYSFRKPLALSLFEYRFDAVNLYPKTCIDCCCGKNIGHVHAEWKKDSKIFYVLIHNVFLQSYVSS